MGLGKRGVFFSGDALMALVIILIVLLLSFPQTTRVKQDSDVNSDILSSLSTLKVYEVDNAYVQSLILTGVINNTNKSLLEQIGEFYVLNVTQAKALAGNVLSDLETNENVGLWYGSTLIYAKNKTPIEDATEIDVDKQFISGLQAGESVTGFSARAFLASSLRNKYVYFGGYVGDGNLSFPVNYGGVLTRAAMELVINNDFKLYVNDVLEGEYSGSVDEFTPVFYNNVSIASFNSGENVIEFKGENLHIAGGFFRITYDGAVQFGSSGKTKYYFPGMDGVVNLYDGFYVPTEINSMNVFLHLNSTKAPIFLSVGDVVVFNRTTNDEELITISNAELSSLLNYGTLSQTTVPLRLGLVNGTFEGDIRNGDIFTVIDLSASMNQQCSTCSPPTSLINLVKPATHNFAEALLNHSLNNRIGLVGYKKFAYESDYHNLSNNNVSLHNKIDSWSPSQGNCICCGINRAVQGLLNESNSSRYRAMVVMGDGRPQEQCAQQGTGSASQDAIQAACESYNNYGFIVHAIGFGPNNTINEPVMQQIAQCGGGNYYYSSETELLEVFLEVANNIIVEFFQQSVIVLNAYSRLYQDSNIEFSHATQIAPFGLRATSEKRFIDENYGSFFVPDNTAVLDAQVASYSGPRWTDKAVLNGENVYYLPDYGNEYLNLGDPFIINMPTSLVNIGESNYVNVTTGTSPLNSSAGSAFNKIIYTVLKNASAFSPISASANGCFWNLEFEDGSVLNVKIPSGYTGSDLCYYNSVSHSLLSSIANENDAMQLAVFELLEELDFDGDGLLDVLFSAQDLQISTDQVTGIPFPWSTEVQARIWRP